MKKANEIHAGESFIHILNTLTGIKYTKGEEPDEFNRGTFDIDFIFEPIIDKGEIFAAEHTRIESFEGEIGYVNRSYDVVASINVQCRDKIPSDRYYFLSIPPILMDSLVGKRRTQFVGDLSSWVLETAYKLLIDDHTQIDYDGHKVILMCRGSHVQLNGNLWRMPQQPDNKEIRQIQRLNKAIKDKVPKLYKYKKWGFKTVLLLEDVSGVSLEHSQECHGMSLKERNQVINFVDYIIVFSSHNDRMIVGNVWKEGSTWHSIIPYNRRFSF